MCSSAFKHNRQTLLTDWPRICLWWYLVLSAWSCAATNKLSVSPFNLPLVSHFTLNSLFMWAPSKCLKNFPWSGLFAIFDIFSFSRDFFNWQIKFLFSGKVISLYFIWILLASFCNENFLLRSSFFLTIWINLPFSDRIYSARLRILCWCRDCNSSKPLPPSFLLIYNLSTSALGWCIPFIVNIFLVFLSSFSISDFSHGRMPKLYIITGVAKLFMAIILFLELSWVFKTFFTRLKYSLFTFSFITLSLIPFFSSIPRYL